MEAKQGMLDYFQALENVIDPELGIDIINLGLVYDIKVEEGDCTVSMTLTTMGCPLTDYLSDAITQSLLQFDTIQTVDIELVWDPVWTPERMSRFARIALGFSNN